MQNKYKLVYWMFRTIIGRISYISNAVCSQMKSPTLTKTDTITVQEMI